MKNLPLPLFLYLLACYLLATVCMLYMSIVLYDYLQIDPIGYSPSVGQWLVGLFLSAMLAVVGKRFMWLNPLFLIGLAALVSIF